MYSNNGREKFFEGRGEKRLVAVATSMGLSYITTHHVLAGGFTVAVVVASFYIFYHSLQVSVKEEEHKGETEGWQALYNNRSDIDEYENKTLLQKMAHYWKQHEVLLSEAKELMESKNVSVKKVNKAGRVRMKVSDTPLPASPAKKEASGTKKFMDDESWAAIKRLSGEFKGIDHKFVIPATLLSWVLIYIDFNTTIVSGQLLDMVVKREVTFEELLPKGYTIILSNLLSFMINVAVGILFALANHNLTMRMRLRLFASILNQDIAFFDAEQSGSLASRISQGASAMQGILNGTLNNVVTAIFNLTFGFLFMLNISWKLTIFSLIFIPLAVKLSEKTGVIVSHYGVIQQDSIAKANAVSTEVISNIRTVKSHAAESIEYERYKVHIQRYLQVILHSLFSETTLRFLATLLSHVNSWVITFTLYYFLLNGEMTVGQFNSFGTYRGKYVAGFSSLTSLWVQLKGTSATAKQFFDLLDRKASIIDGETKPTSFKGEVTFDKVCFSYPSRQNLVLDNISFTVSPGEILALVGPSGAGKSTCFNLLERFYDPSAGRGKVTVDNIELTLLDQKCWRQSIGYVSQEPVLFNRTIAENIAFGMSPLPTKEDIVEAAKIANAHEFIESLEDGYLTVVGERGVSLSGGQRQRIAIARALIRNPTLLLLDEATSSLDAESEYKVQTALERAMTKPATIVIAHRLSTIKRATCIAVIENGKIVEKGRHDELMVSCGLYQRFVKYQLVDVPKGDDKDREILRLKERIEELEETIRKKN